MRQINHVSAPKYECLPTACASLGLKNAEHAGMPARPRTLVYAAGRGGLGGHARFLVVGPAWAKSGLTAPFCTQTAPALGVVGYVTATGTRGPGTLVL